jgi:hypothetical protein
MRFRPNLLTLEDRHVPAALMAGSESSPAPIAIHGQYDISTSIEHDGNVGGGKVAITDLSVEPSVAETDAWQNHIRAKGTLMN